MKKFIVIPVFSVISLLSAQEVTTPILSLGTESLLGSVQGGKFYSPKETYNKFKETMPEFVEENTFGRKETYLKLGKSLLQDTFSVYNGLDSKKKNVQLKSLRNADDYCTDDFRITTNSKLTRGIALSDNVDWSLMPRKVKPLAKNSKIYNKVVKDVLLSKSMKNPKVAIREIFRTDLDNDGQEEVVIVATHSESYESGGIPFSKRRYAEFGDYSFIMIRNRYKGKVNTILLGGSFQNKKYEDPSLYYPFWYELTSILDLNGDGKMEIVVYSFHYEGSFMTVYELKDGKMEVALSTGCGV